jgi:hypothetical protein
MKKKPRALSVSGRRFSESEHPQRRAQCDDHNDDAGDGEPFDRAWCRQDRRRLRDFAATRQAALFVPIKAGAGQADAGGDAGLADVQAEGTGLFPTLVAGFEISTGRFWNECVPRHLT